MPNKKDSWSYRNRGTNPKIPDLKFRDDEELTEESEDDEEAEEEWTEEYEDMFDALDYLDDIYDILEDDADWYSEE